jgi:hypothetical protein
VLLFSEEAHETLHDHFEKTWKKYRLRHTWAPDFFQGGRAVKFVDPIFKRQFFSKKKIQFFFLKMKNKFFFCFFEKK